MLTTPGVGAITGIGLASGTGFFVGMMVGGGFLGMALRRKAADKARVMSRPLVRAFHSGDHRSFGSYPVLE
jgi:hypothetical protein